MSTGVSLPYSLKTLPWAPCMHLIFYWPNPSHFQLLFWNQPALLYIRYLLGISGVFASLVFQISHCFSMLSPTQTLIPCRFFFVFCFLLVVAYPHLIKLETHGDTLWLLLMYMLSMWFFPPSLFPLLFPLSLPFFHLDTLSF